MEASFFGRTGMRFGWEYAGRGRNITRGRLRYKTSISWRQSSVRLRWASANAFARAVADDIAAFRD